MLKFKLRRGDMVTVIAGHEKGKRGKILKINREQSRAIVEKVNLIKKHSRPGSFSKQGGIVEKEGPVPLSNLMLVCPKCDQPVRTGRTQLEDGTAVRACKKCGELLDKT